MAGFTIANLPASEADIDFSDLEREFVVPEQEETLENVVVVDNLPVVDESKEEKLIAVLKKLFKKQAGAVKDNGIHMPHEEVKGKNKTKGFAFVEFETAESAQNAIRNLSGFKLDKTHVLVVNPFMDIEKYSEVDEKYQDPPEEPFVEKEHLKSWLGDEFARDEFAMYADQDLSVLWNEKTQPAEKIISRSNWTETYVQWSPLGSYMCTFHRQGLVLWGGPSWKKLMRFVHLSVKLADFSPNERYLVTWSNEPINVETVNQLLGAGNEHQNPYTEADEGNTFCVWDAHTGALLRSFAPQKTDDGKAAKVSWPHFKWSPSEKYFARMSQGSHVAIYEAPSMGLLDKKSIKVPGIQDFAWCPRTKPGKPELMAYWTPEEGNLPARVSLISVPDKALVRTKNLFSVSNASLHWHPEGNMLCVRVQRYTKSKKSQFTNLEIFRTGERDVPVDVIELKDCAVAFDWEPTSENFRFAVIHTDDPTPPPTNTSGMASVAAKTSVSFYAFERKGKLVKKEGFKLLKTLDRKNTTALRWSPRGRHIVLATLRTTTAWDLEFYDVEFDQAAANKSGVAGDAISQLGAAEHYGVTDLDWDPTGRYVITSASSWRHTMENGYILWDFKGQQLRKEVVERFKQILWRPRPKTLLSDDKKREIRKNLKNYSTEFDEQDERKLHAADAELISQRRRLISEWDTWRESVEAQLAKETEEALANGYKLPLAAGEDDQIVEEIVEEIVDEKEEVVA
ncbi:translation initiation factor eIF-3b [Linderina pennispora]|uniref:Eukaryotic translation initiation factor 3 subunit B n=1 Tax=Linderina pennispora TaxID=61395 RepID=A0A1Y1WD14_9FUNG|nr:translation initiation factor eIF-3b [Linderina pennispora]ORX71228.1 translation initiation factor eIF-3b [Linderina pennispora]